MDETGKTQKEKKIKSLPCILSEEERVERGGALASVVISIANHEKYLAERTDDFKLEKKEIENKISKCKARVSELSEIVSEGSEKRDVDCEVTFDHEAGTVVVRRLDTDEVIEDREMEGLENQMRLEWERENTQEEGAVITVDPKEVVCADCNGAGIIPPDGATCETCKGEGVPIVDCDECEGTGGIEDEGDCGACKGTGYVLAADTVVIDSDSEETEPETEDGDDSE